MTGNATQFALAIVNHSPSHIVHFGLILLFFWFGAVASAFMTESAQRRGARSKYILPMAAEGLLLASLALLLSWHVQIPPGDVGLLNAIAFTAAFAMGLQNAT